MLQHTRIIAAAVAIALMLAGTATAAPSAPSAEALEKAFDAAAEYDWGDDRGPLKPIDQAVVAAADDAELRTTLEQKLIAVVEGDGSLAAKDYACRKLSLVGSPECVPVAAALLPDEKLSHMGRYILERVPGEEAVAALRGGLEKTKGLQQVGVINSLGVRRDTESIDALAGLLKSSDEQIAAAAVAALGNIGTPKAADALGEFQDKAPEGLKVAAADAYLACAEQLLADGEKLRALKIYKALTGSKIKHVKLAATRGLLAAAKK
ncbi:MAG: HEAT repeat domain-containing protein [Pirellulales bacterium]